MTVIEIDDTSDPLPGLHGSKVIEPNVHALIEWIARDVSWTAHRHVRESGVFHLAVAQDQGLSLLFRTMMIDSRYRLFPWNKTHLWLVDERQIDPDHEQSHYGTLYGLIVEQSDIPSRHAHQLPAMTEDGIAQYEQHLRAALDHREKRLDYILLGMDERGRTGSIDPHSPSIDEPNRWLSLTHSQSSTHREPSMSMTIPFLNAARRIVILTTGKDKHPTLRRLAAQEDCPAPVASLRMEREDAQLIWCLDHAAAVGSDLECSIESD